MCETGEMGITGQQQLDEARVLSLFFFILVILKRWALASWTSFVAGVHSRDTGGHEELRMGGEKPATLGARRKTHGGGSQRRSCTASVPTARCKQN